MTTAKDAALARARALREAGNPRGAVEMLRLHAGSTPSGQVSDLLTDCAMDLARAIGGNHSAAALDELVGVCDDAYRLATDRRRREHIGGIRAAARQTRANLEVKAPAGPARQRFRDGFQRWVAPDIAAGRHSDAIRSARAWLARETDPEVRTQLEQFLGPYVASNDPNAPVARGRAVTPQRRTGGALVFLLAPVVAGAGWALANLTIGLIAAVVVLVLLAAREIFLRSTF